MHPRHKSNEESEAMKGIRTPTRLPCARAEKERGPNPSLPEQMSHDTENTDFFLSSSSSSSSWSSPSSSLATVQQPWEHAVQKMASLSSPLPVPSLPPLVTAFLLSFFFLCPQLAMVGELENAMARNRQSLNDLSKRQVAERKFKKKKEGVLSSSNFAQRVRSFQKIKAAVGRQQNTKLVAWIRTCCRGPCLC